MATVESVLFDRVTTYAGVSALMGTRLYAAILPPDVTLPCMTYKRVAAERTPVFGGVNAGPVIATFEFTCWAMTYLGVRALADQLRQALDRWATTTGVTVEDVFLESESDDVSEVAIAGAEGSDVAYPHFALLTFRVIYRES